MPILAPAKSLAAPPVSVDYPRQDEMIVTPEYAVRITAPRNVRSVEVCIDHGTWSACRMALGYWWYDWAHLENGEHDIVARVRGRGGRRLKSEVREFFVVLETDPELL